MIDMRLRGSSKTTFTKKELMAIGKAQGLTSDGADYVLRVMRNGPSRSVENNVRSNVISYYPSVAMGETRQSASKGSERLGLLRREFDRERFLYWMDQPEAVFTEGIGKNGRRYRSKYTADLLDVEKDRICVTEEKLKDELEDLVRDHPSKWQRTEDGYRHVPAAEAFARLGIVHRVEFPDLLAPIFAENIQLLLQARRTPPTSNDNKIAKNALQILESASVMRIDELLRKLRHPDAFPILRLISENRASALLHDCRLSLVGSSYISLDEAALREVRENLIKLHVRVPDMNSMSNLPVPTKLTRLCKIADQLDGISKKKGAERSLRRYKAIINTKGFAGLIDNNKGNRTLRLTPDHESLITAAIDTYYDETGSLSLRGSYNCYISMYDDLKAGARRKCGKHPVCLQTFSDRLNNYDPAAHAATRGGRRAARAAERPTDPDTQNLPASRAFQIAHIDHCLIKLYLVSRGSGRKKKSKRAWLTFMVDEYGSEILATALTFSNPSRRTCARVLRDCIRRHGRLPEGIITDAGSDFRSSFLGTLLAWKLIEKFQRPVAAGRWGQEVEGRFRMFLKAADGIPGQMIKGNSQSRGVSQSHKPHRIAALSFLDGEDLVDHFVRWNNEHVHGRALADPSTTVAKSLETFSCSGHITTLDAETMALTSVPISKDTVKITNKGIHIQDNYYWSDHFAGMEGKRISDVRTDPENNTFIYFIKNGLWQIAKSREYRRWTAANLRSLISTTVSIHEDTETSAEIKRGRSAAMGKMHRTFKDRAKQNATKHVATVGSANRRRKAPKKESINWQSERRHVAPLKVFFNK